MAAANAHLLKSGALRGGRSLLFVRNALLPQQLRAHDSDGALVVRGGLCQRLLELTAQAHSVLSGGTPNPTHT
jgi:hypothetical protein